jgi:DNA-binding transcriptional LysR family regulator
MEHLKLVRSFVHAARAGSFTKTGRELGITPQAVSVHIRQLEQLCGVPLFSRTTRKINLTAEGQRLAESAQAGLETIEAGLRSIQDGRAEPSGEVRVTVPYGLGQAIVAPMIPELFEVYPDIRIELVVQNDIPDMVMQNVDIGIIGGELPVRALIARKVASFHNVLCAAPRYLERFGIPRTIDDLGDHRSVMVRNGRTGKVNHWVFHARDHKITTVEVEGTLTVNDTETQRRTVLLGAGIGQLASFFVAPNIRAGNLVPLLTEFDCPPINIYIYMPQRAELPRRARAVSDFFTEKLQRHPDLVRMAHTVEETAGSDA